MTTFLQRFFELCAKTNIEESDNEETERYVNPPRITRYINWWWDYQLWNKNRKD